VLPQLVIAARASVVIAAVASAAGVPLRDGQPAQPHPPTSSAPSTDVEIAIASLAPAPAAAVREDLEDLLARRGITARYRLSPAVDRDEVLRPAAEAPCALACIWIDLGVAKPARAFVYISATAAEQVVIRSLPLPAGVDEVAREEVAHIVATSLEALQEGRPIPIAASAEPPLVKAGRAPVPPAGAGAERTVWLAGLGGGAAHERAGALALPMAAVSLVVGPERRRLGPSLWLSAGAFSSDAAGDPVALRFRGGELAALAALGTRATDDAGARRRVILRLGLGPGVELRETTASAPSGATGVSVDSSRVDPTVFVRAAARLEVRLSDPVGLFVAAACDVRVVSRRYTVRIDDMKDAPVYQPDLLRPALVVGLDARIAGEAAP
jgi:hypothetical protein